jgi:hypothetical protein
MQNKSGMTPLHYLCTIRDTQNYIDTFKDMTKYKDIWSVQDEFLYTPFHVICQNIKDDSFNEFFSSFMPKDSYQYLWQIQNKHKKTPEDLFREKEYEIM